MGPDNCFTLGFGELNWSIAIDFVNILDIIPWSVIGLMLNIYQLRRPDGYLIVTSVYLLFGC